jgi:CBS domain-containing protein
MRHYQVRDVMTADPVTVTAATPVKDLADILVRQRVGALPVLTAQGKVVGIVTEADLLRKEELQRDLDGQHSMHLTYRARRALASAENAREIMSTHPATVRAGATVNDKLLGMVSPRDLLRVFLRPDAEIRAEIISGVLTGYLGTNPALVHVDVTDGVVRLAGELELKSMLSLVMPMIRDVDGVIDVEGQLSYAIDDTRLPAAADITDY